MVSASVLKRQREISNRILALPNEIKEKIVNKSLPSSHKLIDSSCASLSKHWDKFCNNHDALLLEKGIEDTEYYESNTFAQAELAYLTGLTILEELRPPSDVNTSSSVNTTPIPSREILPPLPKVSIPEFSGSYLEWESFRDVFEGIVLNRKDVTEVQKLLLLKSALKGEAALLVRNIASTAANFRGAWQAVCARYTNERLLVNAHLSALFDLPTISQESASVMRALLDRVREELRALRQLSRPVEYWYDVIVFMILRHLDSVSRREWELYLSAFDAQKRETDPQYAPTQPTFVQLETFLESRIRALEMSAPDASHDVISAPNSRKIQKRRVHQASIQHVSNHRQPTCSFCGNGHSNFSCDVFRRKNPQERLSEVRKLRLCLNCLGTHMKRDCKSNKTFSMCKQTHNSLLHDSIQVKPDASETGSCPVFASRNDVMSNSVKVTSSCLSHNRVPRSTSLLTTAIVTVASTVGKRIQTRALLDSGSEVSFVTEHIVQCLQLPRQCSSVRVIGVDASASVTASSFVELSFESRLETDLHYTVRAYVLPRLSGSIPSRAVSPIEPSLLSGLQLADPSYYRDQKIGLLLGADVFGSLLRPGIRIVPGSKVVALNTSLGWVLTGTLNHPVESSVSSLHCSIQDDLNVTLRRFWEMEEIQEKTSMLSPEEQICEQHFCSTYRRDEHGRFIVRLPRRVETRFGENFDQAVQSLFALERRLARDVLLKSKYTDFMHQYESMAHMEKAESPPSAPYCYLPHHAVTQEGPQGSKLRVVFDASRKDQRGHSLNQALLPGPALQNDLTIVLTRWRNYRFVFCADIVKMFRQILVDSSDRDLQRIVWRVNPSDPVIEYRLNTVTYGTACAPYIAIRVLHELANLERARLPIGAECLVQDSYVDDILSGADSLAEALTRRDELIELLSRGQFELSKWFANHPVLLHDDSKGSSLLSNTVELPESTKMLGIFWDPKKDEFHFKERVPLSNSSPRTKRTVLSRVAQLFDPLGWISPVTVVAKIFLQDLWLSGNDWDEPLEPQAEQRWLDFEMGLSHLAEIKFPRWTRLGNKSICAELHGFADASNRAYAAAAYLRLIDEEESIHTTLLIAKTKVAPVKTVSIPRLELCAAHLLVRLFLQVRRVQPFSSLPCIAWSDSMVVLAWIRGHPSRWKTFVANRVSYIQTSLPDLIWRHVPSADNPADIASRGVSPFKLSTSRLWLSGPHWLSQTSSNYPLQTNKFPTSPGDEAPTRVLCLRGQVESIDFDLLSRYSSLSRVIRITAHCLRFAYLCRKKRNVPRFITPSEIGDVKTRLIRLAQESSFANEIAALRNSQRITRSSSIHSLYPFLDESQVLRVGGRLENARLPRSEKHPPILSKFSPLSLLFVRFAHESVLHAGLALTTSFLQKHVWIVRGRMLVKRVLRTCVLCRRQRPSLGHQLMGQLPEARVTPSRPFLRSGVDYAGPIRCRTSVGRGQRSHKAYIALFVCLSTKAIHIEAVSDLTTKAFLAAFRRFVARRDVCSELWSDNGTTFVGANAELKALFRESSSYYSEVATDLTKSGTHWRFIPPASPHFGGLWEAGIKSAKGLLRKIIGDQTLTFEELSRTLAQIEACLNSRPLVPLSSDTSDLSVLTPAHFLVGSCLLTVPESEISDNAARLTSRWKLVQKLQQHFWRKWSQQYLHHLQQRSRWRDTSTNFSIGQLVIVHNPSLPPGKWALGRVIAQHPGPDGLVRVVTVRTATNELRRPICRLSPLLVESKDDIPVFKKAA